MSLSFNRIRRPNAGSKMSQLLDTEEYVDQFYDKIYGGFQEDDNDTDFNSDTTDSDDSVDSDFSIDENDEPKSDTEVDDKNKSERKRITTVATVKKTNKNKKSTKSEIKSAIIEKVPLELDIPEMRKIITRRELRNPKVLKTGDLNKSIYSPLNKSKPLKEKIVPKVLTQKELLEEALITEKQNLKSLEEYQRNQFEKNQKTSKFIDKHVINGPFIRYNSIAMPLIQEIDNSLVDDCSSQSDNRQHSRTFITFSDNQTFDSFINSLSKTKIKETPNDICPVTNLPARYFDPISQLPFANSIAFNTIRDQYYKYLEIYGNTNQMDIKQWSNWRLHYEDQWKEWTQKYNSVDETVPLNENDCESQSIQIEPNLIQCVESVPNIRKTTTTRKRRRR
ncbi:vacuolar protein sorting-associated protein 72 homolog [Oppia nitens]|uniref:vacuolar protein sorting-associated protein 72 homolog n=1 Tax=Oppia nitens TaxID=1686743 RepID=UPI0023DACEE5|nr:vacuolar protein sorting-associated protein 72 homolog [Oppia nitens]